MNYTLAKQLKDAGFPLSNNPCKRCAPYFEGELGCPTLSELIEACGDYFVNLERLHSVWVTNIGKVTGEDIDTYQTDGKTPEEAVANLWLYIGPLLKEK